MLNESLSVLLIMCQLFGACWGLFAVVRISLDMVRPKTPYLVPLLVTNALGFAAILVGLFQFFPYHSFPGASNRRAATY